MATKTETKFVVKKVKPGRKEGDKPFYMEIGLDARHGTVLDVAERGATKVVQCEAPLRRMFGYATELRSATQGRALFTMRFDRFDAAP